MPGTDDLDQRWKDLMTKYISNTCTRQELEELLRMVRHEEEQPGLGLLLRAYWEKAKPGPHTRENMDPKFSRLMKLAKENGTIPHAASRSSHFWLRAVAAILIGIISITVYFFLKPVPKQKSPVVQVPQRRSGEVQPGSNKAVLTLSNGSTLVLDSTQNGTITTQGNTRVQQFNGVLAYNKEGEAASSLLYNTVSTPRGGQYQLVLSDGSRVWLNAASSLKFPATFSAKERTVELQGEAYFEVVKNRNAPFTVGVQGMQVKVLGTHFNLNSYNDETATRTTLLEGSIEITSGQYAARVNPGQQAERAPSGRLSIIPDADLEEVVAWKEGRFQFSRADIFTIMRQLQRWYNVEVVYQGTVASHFVGTIPRSANLSQVLHMLELTNRVRFEVHDRQITVSPT